MNNIFLAAAIGVAAIVLTLLGFAGYLLYTNWKNMKELRDEGFYD